MEILLIKDSRGKNLLVFSKENMHEYKEMGDKVDDFEILQVLGQGRFGFVAKVKSLINHKIYAMKQLDFSTLKDKKVILLSINETKLLSELNHPLIVKYYKSIKEKEKLYIIMEFMNNGDLGGLMKAHKTLEKPIEEEKLYQIFIQAMKSLAFIHSKNLIHRDIKPENLFISVDGIVKLGDFGVSATIVNKNDKNKNYKYLNDYKNNNNMFKGTIIGDVICNQTVVGTPPFMSPEMINELIYDLKTDVYSMGVTFFELCFWHLPRTPTINFDGGIKLNDEPIKNNKNYYSNELINIIYKMIEIDKNKRPDSATVLNLLNNEFNRKYARNSSIGSVLCCLYAYEEFTEYLKKPNNQQFIKNNFNNKPISFAYLYGITSINNNINEDWNNSLCRIRNVLTNENNRYSGNKEMDVRHILNFLLGKMNHELNQNNNAFKRGITQSNIECSIKNEALNRFIQSSQENIKSPIFDYFYGIMKTKTACEGCEKSNRIYSTYSFNYFYFVSFNIDLAEKQKPKNEYNVEDLFTIQNDICIKIDINKLKYCTQCNSAQVHFQRKQFFSFPPFLIVCFDRGNHLNKKKIFYNLNLDLSIQCEYIYSPKYYNLIGIVKRLDKNDKEHYIALYFDYMYNSWILRDDSSITKINSPMEHNQGFEMILFYKRIKDDSNIPSKNAQNFSSSNDEWF